MKVNNNIILSETSFDDSLICLFENNKYLDYQDFFFGGHK